MTEPVLSIRNLTKRFGGLVAVNDVSWDVYPGEVVALLGDNGAGKSTLIKCVSGVYLPDEGEIHFEGRLSHFARPMDARRQGIETIYQDLALANNLDVSANIFLGREVKKRYFAGLVKTLDEPMMLREVPGGVGVAGDPIPEPHAADREPLRRAAAGRRHRPRRLLGCPVDDHGRTDQQSRRSRAAKGPRAHQDAAGPRSSRDLDHAHAARRLRSLRSPHGHAAGAKGDGEAYPGDACPGARAIYGGALDDTRIQ